MKLVLLLLLIAPACVPTPTAEAAATEVFRVCADPNNLPFSNRQESGFENALARLFADELQARLEYTWHPQRRGFIKNTLKANRCDVVMGVPSSYELALTTAPLYRSSYVFVTRKDGARIESLDDPALARARIGAHMMGDDGATSPPVMALARRGLARNIRGFLLQGDLSRDSPPIELIEAVDEGEVDVAIAWGPLAGYYAKKSRHPLVMTPIAPPHDEEMSYAFDISLGVRKGDSERKQRLEEIMHGRRADIEKILDEYGVPRLALRAVKEIP